jgi:hypothetical protein
MNLTQKQKRNFKNLIQKKKRKENQEMQIVREKAREFLLKYYFLFLKVQKMVKINTNTNLKFLKF